jgi:hypothetical protein
MFILNTVIDLFLAPFQRLPPEVGLAVFSVLLGLVVLLIFKATSNPALILRARNRALARILEMWLYRDDPWVSLGSFIRVLRDNTRYLGVMTLPMLASLLPALLLLAQAYDWFDARPLQPGETALVVAQLKPDAPADTMRRLELSVRVQGFSDGYRATLFTPTASGTCVRIDSPPVCTPALGEIAWRIRANTTPAGRAVLTLTDANGFTRVEKYVRAGNGLARVSRCRVTGFLDWLLHPGEPRLPANQPFMRIKVLYPEARYNFFGLRMGWLPAVLILSLLTGLLLRKPLRVEF